MYFGAIHRLNPGQETEIKRESSLKKQPFLNADFS